MATITPIKAAPYTPIENIIINEYLPQIGAYGFTVYAVIKSYRNQKTGKCIPSYATIAEKAGMDRVTVIRYVKLLKSLNILSPELRFKEDGGPASHQYNFSAAAHDPTPQQPIKPDRQNKGSCTEPPPVVAENNHPSCSGETAGSCTKQPEQSSLLNKKERTRETPVVPTEKQKTCQHPPSEIAHLSDNIIICNHCFAFLTESLTLAGNNAPTISPETALPECERLSRTEGEATTGRENQGNSGRETALKMARESHHMSPQEGKAAKKTNPLIALGKLITGCLKSA